MRKMTRKILSVLLVMALIFTCMPVTTFAWSGNCGDNVVYTLSWDNKVLTISGTGPMTDFSYSNAPWYYERNYIEQITITDGVTTIGNYAFNGFSKLTTVTIPESVTSVGDSAFNGCWLLTELAIPTGVTTIGNSAFYGCDSLAEVNLPNAVTTIGNSAFAYCENLTAVSIPASVTQIDAGAFIGCPVLSAITVDENNESYADVDGVLYTKDLATLLVCPGAFAGECNIPASVTQINAGAFKGCSAVTAILVDDNSEHYADIDGVLYNKALTELICCPSGFAGTCEIPEGVTAIPSRAFYCCQGLTGVNIPVSVESIGSSAFEGCNNLTTLVIPGGVQTVDSSAFWECSSLETVTIGENVVSIGYGAFERCISLKEITIPNSVESIDNYAFSGCSGLETLTIGESVTSIGNNAFSSCSGLTEVTIPDSVIDLGLSAFSGCKGLKKVVIGNNVDCISNYTFSGCTALEEVTIGSGVAGIYNYAFYNCGSLREITIPESVTIITSSAFENCTQLEKVVIGDGVNSIGGYAFYGCTSLKELTLGNKVAQISGYAFYDCDGLTEIAIPASVTAISGYAFYGCNGLKKITFEGDAPRIDDTTFGGVEAIAYYPAENDTWTADKRLNYNGDLIWVAYTQQTCDHSNTKETEGVPATCTETGYTGGVVCADCGMLLSVGSVIEALWHSYENGVCIRCQDILIVDSGSCGEVKWELSYDGTLTIFGTGRMSNYYWVDRVPWYDYRDDIQKVVVEDGVTNIGELAFSSYTNLTSVELGQTVESIGKESFSYCTQLTNITIPDSVTGIGDAAFESCWQLKTVDIGASLAYIGEGVFDGCSSLQGYTVSPDNQNFSSDACLALFNKDKTNLYSYPIARKGEYVIPDTVTVISAYAFSGCSGLTAITLGESVATIETEAFGGCKGLTSVVLPESVLTIGEDAFAWCSNLTEVTIGGSVTNIGVGAFWGCESLTDIRIPDSVTQIGGSAFSACSGLSSVEIGDSVSYIGREAFEGTAWYDAQPDGLVYAGKVAYKYKGTCPVQIVIEEGTLGIAESAFFGCSDLTTVTIPESVQVIGSSAFSSCSNIEEITIPSKVAKIDDCTFMNCTSLAKIRIGSGVKAIENDAFDYCSNLTELFFEGSMPSIWGNAFTGVTATAYFYPDETWPESGKVAVYDGIITFVAICEHDYESVVTAPSCTEQGYTTNTCTKCKDSYVDSYVEAQGHSWTEASCTAPKTCSACNETEGEPLGHQYENYICAACGHVDHEALRPVIELSGDGEVTAFDAQILAEALAGNRTLTDEQWTALGDLTPEDVLNYILGSYALPAN